MVDGPRSRLIDTPNDLYIACTCSLHRINDEMRRVNLPAIRGQGRGASRLPFPSLCTIFIQILVEDLSGCAILSGQSNFSLVEFRASFTKTNRHLS